MSSRQLHPGNGTPDSPPDRIDQTDTADRTDHHDQDATPGHGPAFMARTKSAIRRIAAQAQHNFL